MPRPQLKLILLFLVLASANRAQAWQAEIISAVEILPERAYAVAVDASLHFESFDGVQLVLDLDPTILDLNNPHADTRFHPIEPSQVRTALSSMSPWSGEQMQARIYCLPGLPRGTARSFSIGREIFLAPGLGELSRGVIDYTVTHEMGHVVQHVFMPGRRGRLWLNYMETRGLDPSHHGDDALHRDRPGEIFAEDFRALYGGPAATASHTLENPSLAWPTEIPGLQSFFMNLPQESERRLVFASAHNFPNPFNPVTTIVAELSDEMLIPGERAEITVFDSRGRKLRSLPPVAVEPRIAVIFRGRDDRGRRLASGRYFFEIRVLEHRITGAMTLVQ